MTRHTLIPTALALAATAGALAVPALAATKSVSATKSNHWSTSTLRVKKGDTVRFTWHTGVPHNVRKTSGRGTVKGGNPIRKSGTATFKVPAKGTYSFICDVHGAKMKLTVKAS